MMSVKQRLLSSIKGEKVDRLPWSPFLAYLWESLPNSIQKQGQFNFLESIGADPLIRGVYNLFKIVYNNCEVTQSTKNDEQLIEYSTPLGKLTAVKKYSTHGNTWFTQVHPVKNEKDLEILAYIYKNMEVVKQFDEFYEYYKIVGENGLIVPAIGIDSKTCFQSMVEYWLGTEQLSYALYDFPEYVEEALKAMNMVSLKTAEISAESKAEAFLSWEDTSTTNISPKLYEKYILPEINSYCDIVHSSEKLYLQHACGHLRALMPLIASSKIDAIESISPPPTGNIELWDAKKILGENIAIIGGIEPTKLLYLNKEELKNYVNNLLNNMRGTRFIPANSDSCPPGVSIEKLELIGSLVKNFV